jgi:hypothetical protein
MLPARLLTSVLTWCLLSFLHVASVQGAIVQRDDADPSIQYNTPAVIWLSETNKTDQVHLCALCQSAGLKRETALV